MVEVQILKIDALENSSATWKHFRNVSDEQTEA
jgi:hypothetical protein